MVVARPAWARSQGERKARELGIASFPVDPFAIACQEDIQLIPKQPDQVGVSGGIVFSGNNVGIFYSTDIASPGFQRFTVAHELGHYFLPGHPAEIQKSGPAHVSKAGFAGPAIPIEVEADHFASGLLLPTTLVRRSLGNAAVGLEGIEALAEVSRCSMTASAIRTAECAPYPMAIIVSEGPQVRYCFISDGFKQLGRLTFLRKGEGLPDTLTREFNSDPGNVRSARRACEATDLSRWFEGDPSVILDEEVLGLGSYGLTITVLSSEDLPDDPEEEGDEDADLIESYTARFAYGR